MSDFIVEITKLSIADRIRLVQEILATITAEENPKPEASLTPAQRIEIERRSASIADGSVKTVSWDSVKSKLAERYGI